MPSDLPIITPDPFERRTQAQKYGGAYYLGIGGLAVVIALVGTFALQAWSLRDVWNDVYILHDPKRPDDDRIQAAWRLSRSPKVSQRQYWDIALRKPLPPLARYLMAESLTDDAVTPDPRGYAMAVAYSKDWPSWLRLLILRPTLVAGAGGVELPVAPFEDLKKFSRPLRRPLGGGDVEHDST